MGRYNIGGIVAAILIAIFCSLTGPDGDSVFVAPGSVVSVRGHGEQLGGKAQTVITTTNGVFYVRESVATVIARLRSAKEAEKPIGDDK
jgi:hypothetical protein